jgi:hypothetical protein
VKYNRVLRQSVASYAGRCAETTYELEAEALLSGGQDVVEAGTKRHAGSGLHETNGTLQEIETWVSALANYDNNEFDEALKTFDNISDTSKILFNCGVIHATLGEHGKAVRISGSLLEPVDQYKLTFIRLNATKEPFGSINIWQLPTFNKAYRISSWETSKKPLLILTTPYCTCEVTI